MNGSRENGELPRGWSIARLDSCVDVLDKLRRPVNSAERAKRVGDVPYYGATGQVGWIDQALFNEELVLLGEDGAPFLDKSKPIAYIVNGPSWVNNHAHVLRAQPSVTVNRYIKYFLDSFDFSDRVQGSTRDKLTQRAMNAIRVPLPPLDEQRRIADQLEGIEARRASIAGRLAAAREIVERLRGAVLAAACDGRLTGDFRADQVGRVADADRATGTEATDIAGLHDQVPRGWTWLPLGEISEVRGGIQKKPDRAPRSNAYPYLRVANVLRGRLDLGEIAEFELFDGELKRYVLRSGDLLVVEGNGSLSEIGRAALWRGEIANCVHQNHLIRVRPTAVLPEYLELYWNSPLASRAVAELAVTTAGLYNLSVGKIARVPVPVPPLDEQHEIVRCATASLETTRQLAAAISTAGVALDGAMRGALRKAFRGELVPMDSEMNPVAV